jgi:hypothetical protein
MSITLWVVALALWALTILSVIRWRRMYRVLAIRNVKLNLELQRIVRQHDFMTGHPGKTCEDHKCPINIDKTRSVLSEDIS